MTQEPRTYQRTPYEARLDVSYGVTFHSLNGRFYRRLDFLFGFIGLFGGTAVFSAVIANWHDVAVISGAVLAASAIIERLLRPAEQAMQHHIWGEKFSDLLMHIDDDPETKLQDIETGLRRLQGRGPSGIAALSTTAYNHTVSYAGRTDYLMPVNLWHRFVAALA